MKSTMKHSSGHTSGYVIAVRAVGGLIALFLVIRGIAEFFVIRYNDPAAYRDAWGGPSLAGVFAVHSGPGFVILVAAVVIAWRKRRARREALTAGRRPADHAIQQ